MTSATPFTSDGLTCSTHQRHQSAATGHFQFAEDGMKMSFHRFKTQTSFIGNLLITAPVAYQTRQILFSTRQADQMRQRSAADLISCRCPRLKTLELDEKMRSREGGRTNLFQTDRRAKITSRRMPNCLVPKIGWRETKRSQVFPSLFENATLIENLRRKWSFQLNAECALLGEKLSKAKIQLKILCNARSEASDFLGLSALMLRSNN